MRWSDLEGRRVLIVGTGREGTALAEALPARGIRVVAADESDAGATAWRERFGSRVPLHVAPGIHELRGEVDIAVVSPGVPPRSPLRRALRELGIPETTGTDLWLSEHAARTTAVTGSKGKSTTASLVHALSVAHGVDAALGGNIGVPLLDLPPAERFVAELSSYQASSVTVSPDVVVLTALFPEHLDWHGSEEEYYAGKLNLVGHGPRRVLVNAEDERLTAALARLHPELEVDAVGGASARWCVDLHENEPWLLRDGAPIVPSAALGLEGRHNLVNACLALAAVEAAGVDIDPDRATDALRDFRPLAHRLEPVADPTGVRFIDDSLSTSPYAAIAALDALDSPDVVLLVGGQDRGVDYAPLAEHLRAHPIAAVVGLPDSGPRILEEVAASGVPGVAAADMESAVRAARELVPSGGAVLLSPAAPSYGRYRDFADRAVDFRRAIAATLP